MAIDNFRKPVQKPRFRDVFPGENKLQGRRLFRFPAFVASEFVLALVARFGAEEHIEGDLEPLIRDRIDKAGRKGVEERFEFIVFDFWMARFDQVEQFFPLLRRYFLSPFRIAEED